MGFKTDEYWQSATHHTGDIAPFLLHSLTNHYELITAIIERVAPRNVLEIGSESGGSSLQLAQLAPELGFSLTTIDPKPDEKVAKLAVKHKNYQVITGKSLDHLESLQFFPDVTIIDGDHNYYTVFHELTALLDKRQDRPFAIILHDVGFPSGRRDMYYDPADIPKEFLHPHSYHDGALPGVTQLVKHAGFSGAGQAALARKEGGPKNGVLTAIEDTLTRHKDLKYQQIDAVFGLGIIYEGPTKFETDLEAIIAPYQKPILAKLERNRLANYLRLIELNQQAARLHQKNSELSAALQQKQEELARIQRESEVLKAGEYRRNQKISRRIGRRLGLTPETD